MTNEGVTRRRLLQTTGVSVAAALAGCGGSAKSENAATTGTASGTTSTTSTTTNSTMTASSTGTAEGSSRLVGPRQGDSLPTDPTYADGFPPTFSTMPAEQRIDISNFPTMRQAGREVTLVSADVAYYWWARHEARFADARSRTAYNAAHIFGAVSAPVLNFSESSPVLSWPKDDRIVTYCDCPHHLASLLAAGLEKRGFEKVFAIDPGFAGWREQKYPVAGAHVDSTPPVYAVTGKTDSKYAGETAWVFNNATNQSEAAPIAYDGSYAVDFRFYNVSANSTLTVKTPAYEVNGSMGTVTNGTISENGSLLRESASGNATANNSTD